MKKKVLIDFAYNLNFSFSEIINFIKKNWIRETLLSNDNFYKWQFINPVANDNKDNVVLAIYDSKIVGFLGLNKRDFTLNNKLLSGAELTTWIIQKEYQKKGFAKPMLEHIKNNFDIVFGANITTDALTVYLRLDFHYLKQLPRFVKIYNYNKIVKLGIIDPLIKKISKNNNTSYSKYKNISFENLPDINVQNGFSRLSNDLLWRYKNHPIYSYHIITSDNSSFVIYRIENVDNIKIMIITDILNNSNSKLNLTFLNTYAQEKDIDMIEFYSTQGELNALLLKENFLSTENLQEFIDIAYLYNPLEIKKSKSYSLIYYAKEKYILDLLNSASLYITKADCDLDRPNFEYLKKIKKG